MGFILGLGVTQKSRPNVSLFFFFFGAPPKGAGELVPRESCRKVSKIILTFFDDFWRFLPCAKIVEKCRKYFRHFSTIFDVFWRGPFPPAPFAIRWFFLSFTSHFAWGVDSHLWVTCSFKLGCCRWGWSCEHLALLNPPPPPESRKLYLTQKKPQKKVLGSSSKRNP